MKKLPFEARAKFLADNVLLDWWEKNPDRLLVRSKQDPYKPGQFLSETREFEFAFRKENGIYSGFYPVLRDCLTNAIRSDQGIAVQPPTKETK